MRKKAFIKTQLNLYMKYRINRPAEEDQTAENLQQEIEYSRCSALLCSDVCKYLKCRKALHFDGQNSRM